MLEPKRIKFLQVGSWELAFDWEKINFPLSRNTNFKRIVVDYVVMTTSQTPL